MSYVLVILLASGIQFEQRADYPNRSACEIAADVLQRRADIIAELHPGYPQRIVSVRCTVRAPRSQVRR